MARETDQYFQADAQDDTEFDRVVRAARGEPCLGAALPKWVDEYCDEPGPPNLRCPRVALAIAAALWAVAGAACWAFS